MYRGPRRMDERPRRSRSYRRGGGDMSRYGPPRPARGDRERDRDRDRDRDREFRNAPPGHARPYHHRDRSRGRPGSFYHRRNSPRRYNDRRRSRSNRRSRSRRRRSNPRRTPSGRPRQMARGGHSESTDCGSEVGSRSNSWVSTKAKGASDDSTTHDDTIGSYDGVAGDIIDNRYEILRDAGLGTFGRVLVCKDNEQENKPIVALKVVRKVEKYSDSAKIEADILRDVNEKDANNDSLCVRMHRWFEFQGHVVLVFEKLGCSLYDYLKKHEYKPYPLDSIRAYAWQLLTSLSFLHKINLIHTDLKPENILLVDDTEVAGDRARLCAGQGKLIPPALDKVKLIDFGGATYDHESKSGIINTRQYRSPEVMLGLGWSFPSDIWSAACIIAELYLGELLFVTHENLEHLALIEKCIGEFPQEMVAKADRQAAKYFTSDHKLRWPGDKSTRESVEHVRKMKALEEIFENDKDAQDLLDLLTKMLHMEPTQRLTAAQALQHPFFDGISLENLHPSKTT